MSDLRDEVREPNWERNLVMRLASENLKESRRRRRWSVFFKLLGFAYFGFVLFMFWRWDHEELGATTGNYTALVQLKGVIGASVEANAEELILALQAAFEDTHSKGVILKINSPGGSPVQAGMVNDEIRRLRAKYPAKPLYAVVEDICASGGYYVAVAADKIFVDKASIVGSIGVLMDGFGFTGAMEKFGVERRLITAGTNKGFLDPFSPQSAEQVDYAKAMLSEVHQQFISVVRQGRGKRLKETPEMFSGLMWTGAKSIQLGLSDGFGTVDSVARDFVKAEEVRDYTQHQNFAERFAKRFGAGVGDSMAHILGGVGMR